MSGIIEHGRDLRGAQRWDADVVVVGSGASGAAVACTLAEAGYRVLILEEGPHITWQEHARMRPTESMRAVWREGAFSAALGIGDSPVINVTMGRAVGGSSTITGGVCFRTPEHVLHTWSHERGLPGLSPTDLDPWFDQAERDSSVTAVPESMRSRSTTLFDQGGRTLGAALKPTRRNIVGCDGCARRWPGCCFGLVRATG